MCKSKTDESLLYNATLYVACRTDICTNSLGAPKLCTTARAPWSLAASLWARFYILQSWRFPATAEVLVRHALSISPNWPWKMDDKHKQWLSLCMRVWPMWRDGGLRCVWERGGISVWRAGSVDWRYPVCFLSQIAEITVILNSDQMWWAGLTVRTPTQDWERGGER